MNQSERTREQLIMHYKQYPKLQIKDIFKFIYQSAFGCEHLVADLDIAIDYIELELKNCNLQEPLIERLDGEYSRVHLSYLKRGLTVKTFGKLFVSSSKKEPCGRENLEAKLLVAQNLIEANELPFGLEDFKKAVTLWKENGYPPVRHSDIFRENYKPSYRVIANKYIPFLPIFSKIDKILEKKPTVVAIEGGSASGKSTLSEMLENIYDVNILHMDDFFLRPEQRTPERFAEVGGNIDRERFSEEILPFLSKNLPINYKRFDCGTFKIMPPIKIIPKKLTVVEGVYSMHPEFKRYYDFSVFLDISEALQRERIAKRNTPELTVRFYNEWIPLENTYFQKTNIKAKCDMVIEILE